MFVIVIGGSFCPFMASSVYLVSGKAGCGKSTLLRSLPSDKYLVLTENFSSPLGQLIFPYCLLCSGWPILSDFIGGLILFSDWIKVTVARLRFPNSVILVERSYPSTFAYLRDSGNVFWAAFERFFPPLGFSGLIWLESPEGVRQKQLKWRQQINAPRFVNQSSANRMANHERLLFSKKEAVPTVCLPYLPMGERQLRFARIIHQFQRESRLLRG